MGDRSRDDSVASPTASTPIAPPEALPPSDHFAEARRLLAAEDWEGVDDLVQTLRAEGGDDPRIAKLVEETSRAREKAGEHWRDLVRAAREVNDPARVLELHEGRPPVFDEQARRDLDHDQARWFLTYVHHRLRSGGLQLDLVILVDRVAETLAHTRDGASLRAALPTLRRGAGLCSRCGKPYKGFSEACSECLGRPEPPPPHIPGLEPTDDFDVDSPAVGSEPNWFLDPDDGPGANGRSSF